MDRLELPKNKYQIHRQIEIKNLSAFFITLNKRRNQICYEHAPQMQAADVSDYRQLAAFKDAVLAAT